ncbi:MAG: Clp protease N-terminal domain-containing protein [Bdellovibrionota bacterium]
MYREAQQRRHEYFCIEHLLFALLFDETIVKIIQNCGGSTSKIKDSLEKFFAEELVASSSTEEVDHLGMNKTNPAVQRVLQNSSSASSIFGEM